MSNNNNNSDSESSEFTDDYNDYERILHYDSGVSFGVCGYTSIWWFRSFINDWEPNTFKIIKNYAKQVGPNIVKNTYIDIGSWIGPTVLFAANFYERVIAIEPDPVAFQKLENNISVNSYDNITVINKALTIINDTIQFGGNGCLGNSESTMLVNNKQYITECWGGRWTKEEREQNIIDVEGITLNKLLNDYDIDPKTIALIKMDIEGGEFILIPDIINVLYKYNITLFISIHYVFLKEEHIKFILQILFGAYRDCYVYVKGKKTRTTMKKIINEEYTELLFENVIIPKNASSYCNNSLSCCSLC